MDPATLRSGPRSVRGKGLRWNRVMVLGGAGFLHTDEHARGVGQRYRALAPTVGWIVAVVASPLSTRMASWPLLSEASTPLP